MSSTLAAIYGSKVGVGGLGKQIANALTDLAGGDGKLHAIGPGRDDHGMGLDFVSRILWHEAPAMISPLATRYTWLRWWTGRRQFLADTRLGTWAAAQVVRLRPHGCYCFTQVALETLRWAKLQGVPTVLETPNGHLRDFRDVYVREQAKWCRGGYWSHPSAAMVARVEEEYALADVISVSSAWTRDSLVRRGVPCEKIIVFPQMPELDRYYPPAKERETAGPLRVCFVGTFDLRKGFVYLLQALRTFEPQQIALRMVGGTVDRSTRRLLARESAGLPITVEVGDPLPAYQQSEVMVVPTLEDGGPFVVIEAMAAGLPVIVTDACGNHDLVQPGRTGWVVPARSMTGLREALAEAIRRRAELSAMGRLARASMIDLVAQQSQEKRLRSLFELPRKGNVARCES